MFPVAVPGKPVITAFEAVDLPGYGVCLIDAKGGATAITREDKQPLTATQVLLGAGTEGYYICLTSPSGVDEYLYRKHG